MTSTECCSKSRTMLTTPVAVGFASRMSATDTTVTPDGRDTPARHLLGWDCIEFWVGNARTTAGFLMSHFGFRCTGYAGPETGRRDKASYVLEQGDIRWVVSGALHADSPIADHVRRHGDGVHDLAWLVDDASATYEAALARGARSVREPWVEHDEHGDLELAQVAAYGETVHTFVNRLRYRGIDPGARLHRPEAPQPQRRPRCRPRRHRPRRRQRRPWRTRHVGRLLLRRDGLRPADALRRRADPHRVLGADVHRRVGRQQDRDADQRAGRRSQEEPDPGVHRALRRAGRAAHRPAHRQHRQRRAGDARPRRAVHDRAGHLLRGGQDRASPSSTCRGTSCSGSTSSPTRTTTGTCCRSSRRRSPTVRPCSSRSSSATVPRDSGRATSRPCSRPSSATRRRAAICRVR